VSDPSGGRARAALDRIPAHALGGKGRAPELKVVGETAGVPRRTSRDSCWHTSSPQRPRSIPAAFFALFARRIPAPLLSALEPGGELPAVLDAWSHLMDRVTPMLRSGEPQVRAR
jgi:hypothetical protein